MLQVELHGVAIARCSRVMVLEVAIEGRLYADLKLRCILVPGPELLLTWVAIFDPETRAAVKTALYTVADLQARAASLGAPSHAQLPQHQVCRCVSLSASSDLSVRYCLVLFV